MAGLSYLTVKNKVALFKKDEPATTIELLQFEEVGFECVAQKDLYKVGESIYYVEPDYNITDNSLFESYIRPYGDIKKSKLGSNNRVRAIKFGLHRGDGKPVYSQGLLLSSKEVEAFLNGKFILEVDTEKYWEKFAEAIGIFKYEEPEPDRLKTTREGTFKGLPQGVYKTDETNIDKLWNYVNYPIELYGTEKIDGSSITIYVINGKGGICSRSIDKNIFVKRRIGERKKTWLEKLMFWKRIDTGIYEEVLNDGDDFVRYGYPHLLELLRYCEDNKEDNIILRGELCGKGLKGSGNPKNPQATKEPQILFFGMDKYISGVARPQGTGKFVELIIDIAARGNIFWNTVPLVFALNTPFNSKEELLKVCNDYFKNNFVEGIVVRDEANTFSAKIMNLAYDEKK